LCRLETPLEAERDAIRAKLRTAEVVWLDEATTRINGHIHWHWVFVTPQAVLHEISPRRAKAVAQAVMGGHKPEIWVSDRYAGQQDMAAAHQVRLAHVLRRASNTPSTAATPCSRRRWRNSCPGRSRSVEDATISRTAPCSNTAPRPTATSTDCSPYTRPIPPGARCRRR